MATTGIAAAMPAGPVREGADDQQAEGRSGHAEHGDQAVGPAPGGGGEQLRAVDAEGGDGGGPDDAADDRQRPHGQPWLWYIATVRRDAAGQGHGPDEAAAPDVGQPAADHDADEAPACS